MIDLNDFLTDLPKCKLCNNSGMYNKVIVTVEEQEEYGVGINDAISIKCSDCNVEKRKREYYIKNEWLEDALKWFEISDYKTVGIGNSIKETITKNSLQTLSLIIKDIENLFKDGGFIIFEGNTLSGKSSLAHILAREGTLKGYYPKLISIIELVVELSYLNKGTRVIEDNIIKFDLEEYLKTDLLIIDHFEMINEYFRWADIRRANIVKIFSQRLKNKLPTIILTRSPIKELFSEAMKEIYKFPIDLPVFINKNFTLLQLYGKFKSENNKIEKVETIGRRLRIKK